MKLKTLAAVAALAVLVGAGIAYAFLGGIVVNSTYAVSQVIPIPLGSGVASLSAGVTYSSPSFSADAAAAVTSAAESSRPRRW